MAARTLVVYIDIESPYSYLATELLRRHRERWHIPIIFKPVVIGAIFKATGNKPPAASSLAKGKYNFVDLSRTAEMYGIPFKGLPKNSLARGLAVKAPLSGMPGLRLLTAAFANHGCEDTRSLSLMHLLFQLIMVDGAGKDVHLSNGVLAEACRAAGFSELQCSELMESMTTEAVQTELRKSTEEACARGAFGVPFMYITGSNVPKAYRMWFGADRIEHIARWLDQPWTPYSRPVSRL